VAKQGTAPVADHQLHEVYTALGEMVSLLFNSKEMSHAAFLKKYETIPELGAFISSRLACSMRNRDRARSLSMLELAQKHVVKQTGEAKNQVMSYIFRNMGVHHATRAKWLEADQECARSLQAMPMNATTHFLRGLCLMEQGNVKQAIASFERCQLLDPDYKAPYINLGAAWIKQGEYEKAFVVSQAGLIRHPYTAQAQYNLGVAAFVLARRSDSLQSPTKSRTSKDVGNGSAQLRTYRTAHVRVIVRAAASIKADMLGALHQGKIVSGTRMTVDGQPWLRLSDEDRRNTCIPGLSTGDAWVLIDGATVGLGILLAEVDDDSPFPKPLHSKADRSPDQVASLDPGKPVLAAQEAEPKNGHTISQEGVPKTGTELRERALQALVTARDNRGKEYPWSERDDEMIARLEKKECPLMPKSWVEPRQGWRLFNWRP